MQICNRGKAWTVKDYFQTQKHCLFRDRKLNLVWTLDFVILQVHWSHKKLFYTQRKREKHGLSSSHTLHNFQIFVSNICIFIHSQQPFFRAVVFFCSYRGTCNTFMLRKCWWNKSPSEPCTCTAIHMDLWSCWRHKHAIKTLKCQVTLRLNSVVRDWKTKVVNCGISAPGCSRAVSGLEMCITKVGVLQKQSEAHRF